jgi:hypothetical protein
MISRILPVVLLVISLGLFFGYINPTYSQKVLPLQAEITQYDNTLAAAEDFNQKEAQLATERSALPADAIERLENFLPDGVDNVQLILDLNALAAKSGIQLSNFDIKGDIRPNESSKTGALSLESGSKRVDSIDVSVKAVGSYSAFRLFLAGLEKSLRPMDVVQMDLSSAASSIYTYNITLRIYWLH